MQFDIRTSSSTQLIEINDFKYIADLCKISKCRYFYMHLASNSLFGVRDDISALHQVPIPYAIHTDLLFRNGLLEQAVLDKYDNYFIPEKFPWAIVPTDLYPLYQQDKIYTIHRPGYGQLVLVNGETHEMLEYFPTLRMHDEFVVPTFLNQLGGYFDRMPYLTPEIRFHEMEKDPVIREVYDNKTTEGRRLLKLNCGEYGWAVFYIYKSMFPLNMSDKLEIGVRFDTHRKHEMIVSFYPQRKNNPLAKNTYRTKYSQITHVCYLNLV